MSIRPSADASSGSLTWTWTSPCSGAATGCVNTQPTTSITPSADAPAGSLTSIWIPPCGGAATDYKYSTSSCMPPGWAEHWSRNVLGWYSPAICPSGYTPACTPSVFPYQGRSPRATESARLCAPSGFNCQAGYTYWALRESGSITSYAPYIVIYWASSDLATLETHPLTPDLKPVAASTSPPTSTPLDPSSTGGLSTGAIAGIAIGGFISFAILSAFVVWMIARRRRQKALSEKQQDSTTEAAQVHDSGGVGDDKAVGSGKDTTALVAATHPELPDHLAQNFPTTNLPVEVPADQVAVRTFSGGLSEGAPWSPEGVYQHPYPSVQQQQPTPPPPPPSMQQPPAQGSSSEAEELENLKQKQAKLDAKRQRLLQLQQLDDEEEVIRQRISQLATSSRQNFN